MAESPICVDLHDCININSTMALVEREVLGYEKPRRSKAILNPKASTLIHTNVWAPVMSSDGALNYKS